MKPSEAHDLGLSTETVALVELARQSLGEMSALQRTEGLHSLQSRLAGRSRARVLRWRSAFAAAAMLSGAVVGGFVVWHHGRLPVPISYRVEGAEVRAGGYVESKPAERSMVHFSDGSELSLMEGARVHVRSIDERGARVTLDEGKTHAYIVHAPATRWSFDAGPFQVAVSGTAFGLSWVEQEHRLDVRLENGSVTVSGPFSDAAIALRAGQWLTVRGSEVLIRSLGQSESTSNDATPNAEAPDGAPAAPSEGPSDHPRIAEGSRADRARRNHSAGAAAPSTTHHWAADLAGGKVSFIVDDALRIGLEPTLAESSSTELAALADAARYMRREDVARETLFALRRRFPRSDAARDGAFLLGRLAETQQDARGALAWFVTYLSEVPNGTYASEALGRKMTVVQQLEGIDAARPIAEAYLRQFPHGAYAAAAGVLSNTR